MKRLHSDGYVHIKNVFNIPESVHEELVSQIDKKSSAIFNHNESKSTNDRKRRQTKDKIETYDRFYRCNQQIPYQCR